MAHVEHDFPLTSIVSDDVDGGNLDAPTLVGSPSVDIIAKGDLQNLLNNHHSESALWSESSPLDMKLSDILHPFHGGSIDFDAAARRCFSHPHEAQALIQGKTMLQVAVTSNAPYHVISALLRAYPRMALRSAYATSALFDACRCNAPPDVIELILETTLEECRRSGVMANFAPFTWLSDMTVAVDQARLMLSIHPDGAIIKDDYLGKINALNQAIDDWEWKIHEVLEYDGSAGSNCATACLQECYEKLKLLLRAKDASTSAPETSPLDSLLKYCLYNEAARTETSRGGYHPQGLLTIVTFITKIEREQFATVNGAGDLPLHTIAKMTQHGLPAKTMESIVRLVLDAYPQAALEQDVNGRLPIHLAASNLARVGSASCQVLARAAPQALSEIDTVVGLYPFQAAAAVEIPKDTGTALSDTCQLSLVYEMLLGAPGVLHHSDKSVISLKEREKSSKTMCKSCKKQDDEMARLKKEMEVLRENMILLERENRRLKGYVGEFGSPGNHRKRRSAAAWV